MMGGGAGPAAAAAAAAAVSPCSPLHRRKEPRDSRPQRGIMIAPNADAGGGERRQLVFAGVRESAAPRRIS